MTKCNAKPAQIPAAVLEIAKAMGLDTLETRMSDSLDFHDMAVWTIKDALLAAYKAGQASK